MKGTVRFIVFVSFCLDWLKVRLDGWDLCFCLAVVCLFVCLFVC